MKSNINLFLCINNKQTGAKGNVNKKIIPFAALGALAVIMAVVILLFSQQNALKEKQLQSLNDEVTIMQSDPSYQEALAGIGSAQQAAAINSVNEAIDAYTQVTGAYIPSEIYELLSGLCPSHIQITSYICAADMVSINGITLNNLPPADYAKSIYDSGRFAAVDYTGFQNQSIDIGEEMVTDALTGQTTVVTKKATGYVFTITCEIGDAAQ